MLRARVRQEEAGGVCVCVCVGGHARGKSQWASTADRPASEGAEGASGWRDGDVMGDFSGRLQAWTVVAGSLKGC